MQKQPLISLLLDLEMLNLRAEFNFASKFENWYSCIFFGDYHAFILCFVHSISIGLRKSM